MNVAAKIFAVSRDVLIIVMEFIYDLVEAWARKRIFLIKYKYIITMILTPCTTSLCLSSISNGGTFEL